MTLHLQTASGILCSVWLCAPAVHAQLNFGDSAAEREDRFGSVVARGDFDGDGHQDLAIGMPGEDITVGSIQVPEAGAVEVIYGAEIGLHVARRQFWRQGSAGLEDVPELLDAFGSSLAGDFNDGGTDDLAVGVPSEDLLSANGNIDSAGGVNVIYGSSSTLNATAIADQFWTQIFIPRPVP